jgi:hypothetical protein
MEPVSTAQATLDAMGVLLFVLTIIVICMAQDWWKTYKSLKQYERANKRIK